MVHSLGDDLNDLWLDPCVGSGTFLQALSSLGVERTRIVALDLEKKCESTDSLAGTKRGIDFLKWAAVTSSRFDKIIANPPYVAISKLPLGLQRSARRILRTDEAQVPLRANYWSAFLCASIRLLNPGGSLSFVLPASWDYADYANPLREILATYFACVEVHRSNKPLFHDVRDGCVVLIGRKFKTDGSCEIRYEHDSSENLVETLNAGNTKGQSENAYCLSPPLDTVLDYQTLGDVLALRIGGVTGDARYFLMTESERRRLQLPVGALRPALTRACHLIAPFICAEAWKVLRDRGERIWLFSPPDRLLNHPAVKSYLALLEENGGCKRSNYKISKRDPWYRTVLPRQIDGFISGMSHVGPWMAFKIMPGLTATNTLYTFRFRRRLTPPQKAAWALAFLHSDVRAQLKHMGRRYPDGLVKYEPGDLLNLKIPQPTHTRRAQEQYMSVIHSLLLSDIEQA